MAGRSRKHAPQPDDLSVEIEVRAQLADAPVVHPAHRALVATAITLARKLDEGAGMATAAVAKELRATLDAILSVPQDTEDELDAFVNSLGTPSLGPSPFS